MRWHADGGEDSFITRRVLRCVAVCCSVLQRVAMYCSVLRCIAVCCGVLEAMMRWHADDGEDPFGTECVLQCAAVCCGLLRCVAVCCGVLQRVAVCCDVL